MTTEEATTEETTTEEVTAEDLGKHLLGLREANQKSFAALQSQGAQISPAAIVNQRLDSLLELLDPNMRLQVEVIFEQKMSILLGEAHSDLTRQQLSVPNPAAAKQGSQLFVPRG